MTKRINAVNTPCGVARVQPTYGVTMTMSSQRRNCKFRADFSMESKPLLGKLCFIGPILTQRWPITKYSSVTIVDSFYTFFRVFEEKRGLKYFLSTYLEIATSTSDWATRVPYVTPIYTVYIQLYTYEVCYFHYIL